MIDEVESGDFYGVGVGVPTNGLKTLGAFLNACRKDCDLNFCWIIVVHTIGSIKTIPKVLRVRFEFEQQV